MPNLFAPRKIIRWAAPAPARGILCSVICLAMLALRPDPTVPEPFQPFAVPAGTQIMDVTFTPGDRSLFVTRVVKRDYAIVSSTRAGGTWSAPLVAPFSGRWRDLEEVLLPDASAMIFASNRPRDGTSRPLDAFYHRKYLPGGGGNLWIVRRSAAGWGTPARLPDAVNGNSSTFSPAIAADGTLYFMRALGPKGSFHLFVANLERGTYLASARAPFDSARYGGFDPAVAPDNSFVIFGSVRPPARPGSADLFIAFHRSNRWTVPIDMGKSIDPAGDATEPRLSSDAKTLYFSSAAAMTDSPARPAPNARRRIWSVDLSPWLNRAH